MSEDVKLTPKTLFDALLEVNTLEAAGWEQMYDEIEKHRDLFERSVWVHENPLEGMKLVYMTLKAEGRSIAETCVEFAEQIPDEKSPKVSGDHNYNE